MPMPAHTVLLPDISTSDVVLTGDRPTGPLHLGHLAGSLLARVELQNVVKQTVLVADLQALTDNSGETAKVRGSVLGLVADYLAVGIDPAKSSICLQSGVPELAELTILMMNLVTQSRLERNPTIKTEIAARGFEASVPIGFIAYPVSQAADLLGFGATLCPSGADQLPLVEQTNEIARAINRMADKKVFDEVRHLRSVAGRLPGIDGAGKASKSAGNAINLGDDAARIRDCVMAMYTDPGHLRVEDPGDVVGNVVFAYLDAFDPHPHEVAGLKEHYVMGGLGDMVLKRRLVGVLSEMLEPIRSERRRLLDDPGYLLKVLADGTNKSRAEVKRNLSKVREAFSILELPPAA